MAQTSETRRVAIIGSGPSAFYAADQLLKQSEWTVEVDMFERLPTPFGLVRGGVAPDHPKIKSVTRVYDRTASHPNFRFYGHVNFGTDITHADLAQHYHAIVYAVGAQTDREMSIPGEHLSGSHAATEFVGWYNGHPDYRDLKFDLSQERVAVIGNGNVAMDVARILSQTAEELASTDIADYALEALKHSQVREIYLLGRRGPIQAKFTAAELKEIGELPSTQVSIDPKELVLDPWSEAFLASGEDRNAASNYETLKRYDLAPCADKPRQLIIRFLVSPTELLGTDHVEAIQLVKNEICPDDGVPRPCATEERETLPVGLVFRSVGYHGVPLPDLPFDARNGVIPNVQGRVIGADKQPVAGEYAVGWIKRGPSGIIGTNKADAQETTTLMVEDMTGGHLLNPAHPTRAAVENLLRQRGIHFVTYQDWLILDQIEVQRGQAAGRPRVKFTRVEEMLAALKEDKREALPEAAR
jgi:ferredoxin--NADP+ reductase